MKVKVNHSFKYEVEHLSKTFVKEILFVDEDYDLINTINYDKHEVEIYAGYGTVEKTERLINPEKKEIKHANSRLLYDLLSCIFDVDNPYGTLVGVRPVKLIHEMLKTIPEESIVEQLLEKHRVSEEKGKLLLEIAKREAPYLEDVSETNKLSLYICIPFCPTRCLYCSFPSNDLRQKSNLVSSYLTCLHKEIDAAYENIEQYNMKVDCIYIGGGTPSILSAEEFKVLLDKLDRYFGLSRLKEVTVEAGRPDTITVEKLKVLKAFGVSRICINPQSMNQTTLSAIGRHHSVEAVKDVYEKACEQGFNTINMDLILGLPDEDLNDVKNSINAVVDLNPENITIHTLAVKTSSRLKEVLEKYNMTQSELVEEMLAYTEQTLRSHGYVPYYLYRQKNMVGNFENVGYCKPGYESLYNIRIIEEKHNILALGAGAVSKRCFPEENRFVRIANIKGIETYLERVDDVILKTNRFFKM